MFVLACSRVLAGAVNLRVRPRCRIFPHQESRVYILVFACCVMNRAALMRQLRPLLVAPVLMQCPEDADDGRSPESMSTCKNLER